MNNAILQDKVCKFYTKLPHCIICRKKHIKDVRSRFNYSDLSDISIFLCSKLHWRRALLSFGTEI